MISRFYLKNYLSFKEVDIELEEGLTVFTGPSGAGKSILMDSLLALFGIKDAKASLSEITIEDSLVENEAFDILKGDEIIIKELKKDKTRYFLNNQTLSKKSLQTFSKNLIKHIHVKDSSDFESKKLIGFLDSLSLKDDKEFEDIQNEFSVLYNDLQNVNKELEKLNEDEKKLEELKEYAKYEIEKIELLNPKVDEYERLNELKKTLSKKDKIEEAITLASPIFEYQTHIYKVLELMEKDTTFFDEAMNELTNTFENFSDTLYELEDLDVEEVLDRIEQLGALQKRFGSIKDALEYKEKKIIELDSYENISFEKVILEKKQKKYNEKILKVASSLSEKRVISSKLLEEKINHYLKYLYLSNAKISLEKKDLDKTGFDEVVFELDGVDLQTISSGEFNRLRLALLTSMSNYDIKKGGVLFLDEIDANLSGKESAAIATVLKQLSKTYQIFAISHQPQLTASAKSHFFVDKQNGESVVKKLSKEERATEISRMISGENITQDALSFAKNLLEEH